MKKYISEIHTKSPEHKKKFALMVSASITLIIFGVWAFVKFNDLTNRPVVTENNRPLVEEITPISNITDGIANSLEAIKTTATDLKNSVNQASFQNQNGKIDTSNTNGQ